MSRTVGEVRAEVIEIERQLTVLRHRQLQLFLELDVRDRETLGLRTLADLIAAHIGCTRPAARLLSSQVARYVGRPMLASGPITPLYPLAAAALSMGEISFSHADVIADAIETLPSPVHALHATAVEERLVDDARTLDPAALKVLAKRIVALLDEDGPAPKDQIQHRRRGVWLTDLPDGTSRLHGILTATATEWWRVIFASLGAVRNLSLDEEGNPVTGADQLGPDDRTEPQRQHDALEEAGRLLLENGELPGHAGLPAELLVTIDLKDLETRTGQATTHHGGKLSPRQVLHLAAEMKVIPVILDQELGLVAHGRGKRLATAPQRKAVFARDRGCSFPGCNKVAGQSQVHHMLDWLQLGETNPDNLTITCGYHNNEAPRQGWKARLIKGIPHWIPPEWRDPEQKPRRNHLHHPELLAPPRVGTEEVMDRE